jgi:hypothetical protein
MIRVGIWPVGVDKKARPLWGRAIGPDAFSVAQWMWRRRIPPATIIAIKPPRKAKVAGSGTAVAEVDNLRSSKYISGKAPWVVGFAVMRIQIDSLCMVSAEPVTVFQESRVVLLPLVNVSPISLKVVPSQLTDNEKKSDGVENVRTVIGRNRNATSS